MKTLFAAFFCLLFLYLGVGAQESINIPSNSILKNFTPFETPRTNYRPGTVFRIDNNNRKYFVEDIRSIKEYKSEEGTLLGRMIFTKEELLSVLNLEIDKKYAALEVEIKNAVREFNEQTNVDKVLWDDDKADDIIVDETSKYFIVRETISTEEITYRLSEEDFSSLLSGKSYLKKEVPRGDEVIDFPYSITKKFNEPRRIFYLQQGIGKEPYGK